MNELQKEKIRLFSELGWQQRGKPEAVMLEVQRLVPGVMSFVVEHAGDLIWRMTEAAKYDRYQRDSVIFKARNVYNTLTHSYGFEKEFEENIVAESEFREKSPYSTREKLSPKELRRRVIQKLSEYADAHAELPAYNDLHRLANAITVSIGRLDFATAKKKLRLLLSIAKDKNKYERLASSMTMKNPRMIKGVRVSRSIWADFIEQNVIFFNMPHNPRGFITWPEGTVQVNFYDTPEAKEAARKTGDTFAFMPKTMFENRILPQGMVPIKQLDRDKRNIAVVGALQYRKSPDGSVEMVWGATRMGWKKLNIMNILFEAVVNQEKPTDITYWAPTKQGKKYIVDRAGKRFKAKSE